MKSKFAVGQDVDFVSPDELKAALDPIRRRLQPPIKIPATREIQVDGSGNIGAQTDGVMIYEAPVGFRADILRLALSSRAYTPAAPLTQGWINVYVNTTNEAPEEFFPGAGTTVLPSLYTDGDTAICLKQGDSLVLGGAGLPTPAGGLTVRARMLIRLWPDVERIPGESSR
jgi:hypothetical protein